VGAQWVQTSGPSGGGVSDFTFVGGKILAATFDIGNGVYASTDSGASWHESGLQGIMLTKIASYGNTVLTASTQNTINETDNIYRSNDGGSTWIIFFMFRMSMASEVFAILTISGIFLRRESEEGYLFLPMMESIGKRQRRQILILQSRSFLSLQAIIS